VVLVLLVLQAREVAWAEVRSSLAGYGAATLGMAIAIAAASHLLYGTFDQVGKTYTGHPLRRTRVASIAFVSYAFNLSMGSLIGGLGFRYRLYSRFGLDNGTIARITGLSIAANWLGYLVVAGTAFSLRMVAVPPGWEIGTEGLRWLGVAMVATALAYLAACAWSPRRTWTVRGHEIVLPSLRMASLQLAIAMTNWLLIAALLHGLLGQQLPYLTIVAVMSISAIAGVITHVPAGLGVIEVVFITLLGHAVPTTELIAALLAFRACYYLLPLAVAIAVYLKLEADARALGS
jgi:glycosyltransferase 2 family protein